MGDRAGPSTEVWTSLTNCQPVAPDVCGTKVIAPALPASDKKAGYRWKALFAHCPALSRKQLRRCNPGSHSSLPAPSNCTAPEGFARATLHLRSITRANPFRPGLDRVFEIVPRRFLRHSLHLICCAGKTESSETSPQRAPFLNCLLLTQGSCTIPPVVFARHCVV